MIDWISPDWPVPKSIVAGSLLRSGGASPAPWQSLNVSPRVGDTTHHVKSNRQCIQDRLPHAPAITWLHQTHSINLHQLVQPSQQDICADGIYTTAQNLVCGVSTADCLPLLFCNPNTGWLAAVHAGWRGLANGIVQHTLAQVSDPQDLLVWIGPAIGPCHFEVGPEVRQAFGELGQNSALFRPLDNSHWLADLPGLAQRILQQHQVTKIYASGLCTVCEPDRWFSYRRDGQTSGRFLSFIYQLPDQA